jgi:type I restriction enzyme S subunit
MGQSPIGESCNNRGIGIPLLNGPTEFTQKYPKPVQFTHDAKKISKIGDILFCVRGSTTGRMNWSDTEYAIGRGLAAIRHKNSNKAQYFVKGILDYYLQVILGGTTGSTFPNVSGEELRNLKIFAPLLPEQEAIAEVLSSLDDKIDLLHRQNNTLEKLAETLFENTLKVNSEKWNDKSLSSLIENTIGGEWGKEEQDGDFSVKVCCIRGTDIADLQIGLAERTPIRFVKQKKFTSIQPNDADLILEISGGTDYQSTGRVTYINEYNSSLFPYPLVFSNFCRLIRPVKTEYSYFLYLYIQYLYKRDEFFNIENGSSGIKNLDYKFLLNDLNFLLPKDESDIIEFDIKVRVYFEKINRNKIQIRTLTQIRDTLLPKLMSGEVRVKTI